MLDSNSYSLEDVNNCGEDDILIIYKLYTYHLITNITQRQIVNEIIFFQY